MEFFESGLFITEWLQAISLVATSLAVWFLGVVFDA